MSNLLSIFRSTVTHRSMRTLCWSWWVIALGGFTSDLAWRCGPLSSRQNDVSGARMECVSYRHSGVAAFTVSWRILGLRFCGRRYLEPAIKPHRIQFEAPPWALGDTTRGNK